MPKWITDKRVAFGLMIGAALMAACSAYNPMSADWAKGVPGEYRGAISGIVEVVTFEPDGTYLHRVTAGTNTLANDEGHWAVPPHRFVIELTPTDTFKQVYSTVENHVDSAPSSYGHYQYFPVPAGRTFHEISACVDYDYCLDRVTTAASNSPPDGVRPTGP